MVKCRASTHKQSLGANFLSVAKQQAIAGSIPVVQRALLGQESGEEASATGSGPPGEKAPFAGHGQ